MNIGNTIESKGISYIITDARPYVYERGDGQKVNRVEYTVKRPRGRLHYHVYKYENGTLSDVVGGW